MREPYPERSLGMLLRFIMLRSPMRFLRLVILRLTYPWRSLANLYSAFSERSPWPRATAISLGSSTLSSCESWSISSWSFFLILASGSDMAVGCQFVKKSRRSPRPTDGLPDPAQGDIIDAGELKSQGEARIPPQMFSPRVFRAFSGLESG